MFHSSAGRRAGLGLMLIATFLPLMATAVALRSAVGRGRRLDTVAERNKCYWFSSLEFVTARDWWNNTFLPSRFFDVTGDRIDWIYKRKPAQPIFGDDTMIAGALYTFSDSILKMTIYFPPLYPEESRNVEVYITANESSSTGFFGVNTPCVIQEHTWHCPVRLSGLSEDTAYTYRVRYYPDPTNLPDVVYQYGGSIPKQQGYPRIAAIGCFGTDDTKEKRKLVEALIESKPDLLVFQGDESYNHDALGYGFLELVYTTRNITKNIPTLVQMDDHDYGEGNLWGAAYSSETSGRGFTKPPCIVNAVQELAMSHMPDTHSPTATLRNGIDIYYTNYRYGSVSFAVLEARKFKSENVTGGSLLGHEQEAWLRNWCNSSDDAPLKVVLTQTPFAALGTNATTYAKPYGITMATKSPDTNGFPVAGRTRFMEIAEGCSPLILSGDQHVGLAVSYDDYGVSECASPAAINDVFWRLNFKAPNSTNLDGWGNQYRLHRAWNVDKDVWSNFTGPSETVFEDDSMKAKRSEGFLLVDLNGETATCGMHSYRVSHEVVWAVNLPAKASR